MEPQTLELIKIFAPLGVSAIGGTALLVAKAAGSAVKRELNGTAQRVKDIDSRTKRVEENQEKMAARLITLETIVDERTERREHR